MKNSNFEELWIRMKEHEGETFRTKNGLDFMYSIRGKIFYPNRTEYQVSKADFRKAFELMPCDGPGVINEIVRGPSYVWAVIHDPRISFV
jgi:hypothetical protein